MRGLLEVSEPFRNSCSVVRSIARLDIRQYPARQNGAYRSIFFCRIFLSPQVVDCALQQQSSLRRRVKDMPRQPPPPFLFFFETSVSFFTLFFSWARGKESLSRDGRGKQMCPLFSPPLPPPVLYFAPPFVQTPLLGFFCQSTALENRAKLRREPN